MTPTDADVELAKELWATLRDCIDGHGGDCFLNGHITKVFSDIRAAERRKYEKLVEISRQLLECYLDDLRADPAIVKIWHEFIPSDGGKEGKE